MKRICTLAFSVLFLTGCIFPPYSMTTYDLVDLTLDTLSRYGVEHCFIKQKVKLSRPLQIHDKRLLHDPYYGEKNLLPYEHQIDTLAVGTEIELVAFFYIKPDAKEYYYMLIRIPSYSKRLFYYPIEHNNKLKSFPWESPIPVDKKFFPMDIYRYYPEAQCP